MSEHEEKCKCNFCKIYLVLKGLREKANEEENEALDTLFNMWGEASLNHDMLIVNISEVLKKYDWLSDKQYGFGEIRKLVNYEKK